MFLRQRSIYEPEAHKIIDKVEYTKDVFLLRVATKINPQPGQFMMASVPSYGEAPFSCASFNEDILELIIKKTGSATNGLSKLKPKDNLMLRGPYGKGFPLKELENKSLTIVGAGVGIIPSRALIQYILRRKGKFGNLNVFFSFRSPSEIIMNNDLEKWKGIYNLKINVETPDKNWKGEFGDPTLFIEKERQDLTSSIILCCPQKLIKSQIKFFSKIGFKDNQIYMHLERKMQCAIGKCGTCMMGGEYLCKDGPIFRYDKIKKNREWLNE